MVYANVHYIPISQPFSANDYPYGPAIFAIFLAFPGSAPHHVTRPINPGFISHFGKPISPRWKMMIYTQNRELLCNGL